MEVPGRGYIGIRITDVLFLPQLMNGVKPYVHQTIEVLVGVTVALIR